MKRWPLTLLACLVCTACRFGYNTMGHVAPLTQQVYPPTTSVELVFDHATVERPHEELAFIEVQGRKFADMDELLEEMEESAMRIGAHAVVGIKKGETERMRGDLLLGTIEVVGAVADGLDGNDANNQDWSSDPDTYRSPTLTGVAIRYLDQPQPDSEQPGVASTTGVAAAGPATSSRTRVDEIVRGHQGELEKCFALLQDPPDEVRARVEWRIDAQGAVFDVVISKVTVDDVPFQSCMVEVIQSWSFAGSIPDAGLKIWYPFHFHGPDKAASGN